MYSARVWNKLWVLVTITEDISTTGSSFKSVRIELNSTVIPLRKLVLILIRMYDLIMKQFKWNRFVKLQVVDVSGGSNFLFLTECENKGVIQNGMDFTLCEPFFLLYHTFLLPGTSFLKTLTRKKKHKHNNTFMCVCVSVCVRIHYKKNNYFYKNRPETSWEDKLSRCQFSPEKQYIVGKKEERLVQEGMLCVNVDVTSRTVLLDTEQILGLHLGSDYFWPHPKLDSFYILPIDLRSYTATVLILYRKNKT